MKLFFTLIMLASLGMGCGANGISEDMKKELIVKTEEGVIVMKGETLNNLMHGECIWYESHGKELVKGEFRDGVPYEGTFIDWSVYFSELKKDPYNPEMYGKDWITPFEISFASVKPDYDQVIVHFSKGKQVLKKK